ncbi:hypothetical protein AB685_18815 [Bacillus sp. LL01]|uniref:hypothetical protein n=1 Tax=Bacillus sp. LL01 TaxID=1665556 RepID=UPI00064D1741|nr:hypothetical protein [Bacillus sp. LL01]KMJ57051.1 hypothetical protein AB685_18815 [Bacillus sp. LL01]
MKFVQYALVSLLLISGIVTWFTVYTSFQEKETARAMTDLPVIDEQSISREELEVEQLPVKQNVHEGLTEQMAKDWNIGKDGISIDRLLTLIKEQER